MPAFIRLLPRDYPAPLVLTLCNERGNEIASVTAASGETAVRSAILLLARLETLSPGDRLTVTMASDGAQR